MDSNKMLLLNPSSVSEVVEDLLASDIISKDKIASLKKELVIIDPNLVMDVRHKEIKKESLIDDLESYTRNFSKRIKEVEKEPVLALKDLKTIDKEIAKTRRNLSVFKNQLTRNNTSFMKNIHSLEAVETCDTGHMYENKTNLISNQLNYQFSKHLDDLEEEKEELSSSDDVKVWRSFVSEPKPIINVIASSKQPNCEKAEVKPAVFDECNDDKQTVCINEENLQGLICETETEKSNIRVPNNTPALEGTTRDRRVTEDTLVKHAVQTWKTFADRKSSQRREEEKLKLNHMIKQKFFYNWFLYVKCLKEFKADENKTSSKSETTSSFKKKKKMCIAYNNSKEESRQLLEIHKTNLEPSLDHEVIQKKKPSDEETLSEAYPKNLTSPSDIHCYPNQTIILEESMINSNVMSKDLASEQVGLVGKSSEKEDSLIEELPRSKSTRIVKMMNKNVPESLKKGSSFENRYAAQEKIIAQQLEVIEKQKQLIFDLQAEHLQKQSTLGLKLVETQLAHISDNYRKKLKPVVKVKAAEDKQSKAKESKKKNIDDLADKLTKSLKERQEYCKQLAEKTKMRKRLAEEKRMKEKLEQEEQEKRKMEERKRQRLLQIKIEQKQAEEKFKIALSLKLQMEQTIQNAVQHYERNLLKRYFFYLRRIALTAYEKANRCSDLYLTKLMRRAFDSWRINSIEKINERSQEADKYYKTKLITTSWNIWRWHHREFRIKVQVSDDMFSLKLQERMLRRWLAYTAKQYLQTCFKLELADRVSKRRLLMNCLQRWKSVPKLMAAERERESRCRAWRQTVQELVPDFSPLFAEQHSHI